MRIHVFVSVGLAVGSIVVLTSGCRLMRNPTYEAIKGIESKAHEGSVDPRDDPELDQLVNDLAAWWQFSLEPVVLYFKQHWRPGDAKSKAAGVIIECLSRIRDRRAIPELMKLAKDKEEMISLPAVMSLRVLCDERDLVDIVRLIEEEEFKWKTRMLELLGKLASGEARGPAVKLISVYLEADSPALRRGAVFALKRLGERRFIPKLVHVLNQDSDPIVRIAAAEALASLGDGRGTEYLLNSLDPSGDSDVVIKACFAVRRLGLNEAVPGLADLARGGNDFVRPFAHVALVGIGTSSAAAALKDLGVAAADPFDLDVNAHHRDEVNWL